MPSGHRPGKSPSSLVKHEPYTLSQLRCCSWSICTTGVNQLSVIPHGTLVDLLVVSPTPWASVVSPPT